MRTSGLGIKSDQMRKRMDANQTHAGAWVHDEALQTSASLLHAVALRTTYARQQQYGLDVARYAEPALECSACRSFEGWVLVQPLCRQWTFTDPLTGFVFQVKRTQLPLMPEAACPLYSLQGATCALIIRHHCRKQKANSKPASSSA